MRYWYDTEFIDNGSTIDLISIGMVAEDGREFYFENGDADLSKASEWVKENILPYLSKCHLDHDPHCDCPVRQRAIIGVHLREFCDPEKYGAPEFWGYYSAYDHVALCRIFGTMMDLPKGWPYYTRDLRQWADSFGIVKPMDQLIPAESEHHALADAKWNRKVWDYLENQRIARTYGGISHGG